MPGWTELLIEVGRDDAEPWSDALLEAGALSVQAEDADAESPDEQPLYGEPGMPAAAASALPGWRRTVLTALLEAAADPAAVLREAADALGVAAPPVLALRAVADQDWVRLTQSQFEPIPIGDRLVITPSWHEPGDDGRISIELDPGLAFGTGSHPTTRLCLQWLERSLPAGATVIDYGCGSGILAIAAARLGASRVTGVDIDPQALVATRDNAARNRVEVEVRASADPRPEPADVVVANILSSPLKLLAPVLTDLVRPGGSLVLSGVLERQVDEVAAAYAPRLAMAVAGIVDGWACLAATKPR
ncbi:MAG TPA: 50S ribosomal protein L11 methyltransferase [Burkholderiaceae bacterium]|nr:50S ribosomal protein L11 methyltransferase [Burkholderiaceae bacterium]